MDNPAEQEATLEAAMAQLRARRDQRDRARRARRERQRIVNLRPLDVTHTFKDRKHETQVLCNYLADERVRLITVVGRGGMGKTALVCKVLAELEAQVQPAAPAQDVMDPFAAYEAGLQRLREGLVATHPQYSEALTLQQRLTENIGLTRQHGDTETRRAERSQIVTGLNRLAQAELGQPFDELCGLAAGEPAAEGLTGLLYLSARSTGLSLERIYADVGRMLGEPAAGRLATFWAGDAPLPAKVERLLESLQGGEFVILLDNLEDCLTESGEIAEEGLRLFVEACIRQPGGAWLIATSREQVKTPPAALANTRHLPLRDGLPEKEAIALLRELDPQGNLGLRDAPEQDLCRAAQLTRGIPRALEIVVGILQADPVASLRALLADEALFGEQVVERLVEEGYGRLGEGERRIMEALAVFDRPVEATAVAFLLHPWFPDIGVAAGLRRLVGGHFVSVSRATEEYSLHPLDQEHAYGRLAEDEAAGAYNRRNLELRAAKFYASIRKPEKAWQSIEDLAPQLAEFEHRVRAGDYEGAHSVLQPIEQNYMHLWGHYARIIGLREQLATKLTDPLQQVANLCQLGHAKHAMGRYDDAVSHFQEVLEIAQHCGDEGSRGQAFGGIGRVHHLRGRFDQALDFYEQALAIFRQQGDRQSEGFWLAYVAWAHRNLRDIDRSIALYEEALQIAREVGADADVGRYLGNLGRAYHQIGRLERALATNEEALAIVRASGDRRYEGFFTGQLGDIYRDLGRWEDAIRVHEESLLIAQDIGNLHGAALQLIRMGEIYRVQEDYERAVQFHKQGLQVAKRIGYRRGVASSLMGWSKTVIAQGDRTMAKHYCRQALALDIPEVAFQAALVLGMAYLPQRDAEVERIFAQAIAQCRVLLEKTPAFYEARYAQAAATAGRAVCDPRWAEEDARPELLAPALAEYRRALENCSAPGVVQDAIRDLELIQAAGVEGLEPVFELLRGAGAP